jgi:hypothetical protein
MLYVDLVVLLSWFPACMRHMGGHVCAVCTTAGPCANGCNIRLCRVPTVVEVNETMSILVGFGEGEKS